MNRCSYINVPRRSVKDNFCDRPPRAGSTKPANASPTRFGTVIRPWELPIFLIVIVDLLSLFVPPKIVCLYRIIRFHLSIDDNARR